MDRELVEYVVAALEGTTPGPTGWVRLNCPLPGCGDRRHRFGFKPDKRWFGCFSCGARGVLSIDDMAHVSTVDDLRTDALDEPELEPCPDYYPLAEEPAASALAFAAARAYARTRRLTRRAVREAGVGACVTGPHAGRLIIPITDPAGVWLGWVGRAWAPGHPLPYRYGAGLRRGEILYNAAALMVETDRPVLVCEGTLDALAYWPDAVAVLGQPSEGQLEQLAAARRPVAVVLDGDVHEAGWALAMRLRLLGANAGNVRLPPRLDPDEVDPAALWDAAHRSLALDDSAELEL